MNGFAVEAAGGGAPASVGDPASGGGSFMLGGTTVKHGVGVVVPSYGGDRQGPGGGSF
jgi:hypothetical protein